MAPEMQKLFEYLYAQAHAALQDNRSFAPFAATDWADGQRTQSVTDLPAAISTPGEHLAALITTLSDQAKGGGVKAAGIAFDAVAGDLGDAVCVHLETPDDAVQVFTPYKRGGDPRPVFAEPLVQDAQARIFKR
ncbi:MAG: hypothetical protein AB7G04_01710 [Hyphomonadaceae bacterium]